ncbi:hypothetical protein V2J09_022255 [Rumex salicifolius]
MPKGRIRNKIRHSNLYSFCIRPHVTESNVTGPDEDDSPFYSRIVHCNQPHLHRKKPLKYASNNISTTKYNIATFLPKALYEQFRRAANIYFLIASLLSLTSISPFSAVSMIAPLVIVVGLTMAKEAIEDWRRFIQDMRVNNRKVDVHNGDGTFVSKAWQEIQVGDVVKVVKDQFFPADLFLISSDYEDGICYVETMNLDGETNLKVRRSLEITLPLDDDASFREFSGVIKCESPNPNLYTFVGNFEFDRQVYPLDPGQILLRDSKLRNTAHVYGVAIFINQDIQLYHEESGTCAQARTSNLNEELGQVDTILSDKTGTLTCNQMDFLKCSIAGRAYGTRNSEVEVAAAKHIALEQSDSEIELETVITSEEERGKYAIKGFGFEDSKLMNGNWLYEPNLDNIVLFFRILAICQSAIPEVNKRTGSYTYEVESPDENAFLVAAREFGFEFYRRTQSSVFIRERYPNYEQPVEREYRILNLLEFTSKRKRMSVIVRDEEGQIFLFCKGADSIIFDRLSKNGKTYLEATTGHVNEYGDAGLRTLALSYKKLEEAEYNAWNSEFQKARTSIGADREVMLERVADMMEKELILVGATAVEDKLQKGVPQCIDKLAQAGLKIWVLTGDKMETAINIGFACSLLRPGMKQICISANTEAGGTNSKEAVKENILLQMTNASQMIKLEKDPYAAFALIIDGKTLAYALEEEMKLHFLNLAIDCASVICCRVSPKQKALVTRLVREGTGKTTLAIGDGANDVGMIQEADIGVGISGAEAFGLTLFYFEAYAGFSGQTIYDDLYSLSFNVILTSLPVLALGVFEQDVSSDFPALYQQGPKNLFFDWYRILGWMANGIYCSLVVFFLNITILSKQAFRSGGQTSDMPSVGTTMFTCIIWAVNCQIALTMSHFTWIQHVLIWGSITMWYVFLLIYGSFTVSGYAYRLLVDVLSPAPLFWATTLVVTVACNLPYLVHISIQRSFNPMDHHIIQEIKYYKKDVEDQSMWTRERSKARTTTKIGFTARVEAKIRHLKAKLQKKQSTSFSSQ